MAILQSGIGGEIDHFAAPTFTRALLDAIDQSPTATVSVDLSAVTFMDSAGYHALATAEAYAAGVGRQLIVRNLAAPWAKLVRICDRDRALTLE